MNAKWKSIGFVVFALSGLTALSLSAAELTSTSQRPICPRTICDDGGCPAPCFCLDGVCRNP